MKVIKKKSEEAHQQKKSDFSILKVKLAIATPIDAQQQTTATKKKIENHCKSY